MPERWLPNPAPYPPVPPNRWPDAAPPSSEPEPEPEMPPTSGWPVAAVILVAGAVGVLVTVGLIALLKPEGNSSSALPPTTTSTPAGTTPAAPDLTQQALDRQLDQLIPFVETQRGLKFKTRPVATAVPEDQFVAAWHRHLDALYGPVAANLQAPFDAFAMTAGPTKLPEAVHQWLGDEAVSFYDEATHTIEVRATGLTPYVSYQLVRDLTTALDGQHFDLAALAPVALGDAQFGLRTLLAGDTLRIANLWGGTRPPEEQRVIAQGIQDNRPDVTDPTEVPVGLAEWLSDSETNGPVLLSALASQGDQPRIDQAFGDPPAGSAQALDTGRYLFGDRGVPVTPPPAPDGVKPASQGQLGLLLVRIALQDHVNSDLLSTAMTGYRGDGLTSWEAGGKACARIRVAAADDAAVVSMTEAFRQWADDVTATVSTVPDPSRPGATLVQAERCSGGGSSGGDSPGEAPGGGSGI